MFKAALFATSALLVLAGCERSAPANETSATQSATEPLASEASSPDITASATPMAPSKAVSDQPPPYASDTPAPPQAPLTTDQKGEKGAREVLAKWARGLETGDYGTAWEQYSRDTDPTRAAFVHWWKRYRTLKVTIGAGEMDAGAGSIFYTAPVTVTGKTSDGKPVRLEGPINLRRVNDVDGARPDQLRWHIGNTDLKDVSR